MAYPTKVFHNQHISMTLIGPAPTRPTPKPLKIQFLTLSLCSEDCEPHVDSESFGKEWEVVDSEVLASFESWPKVLGEIG